jgi:hypothetical protein
MLLVVYVVRDLPHFKRLGLYVQYPLVWKYRTAAYYFVFDEEAPFGLCGFVDIQI